MFSRQDVTTQPIEGMYDPAEFRDLDVTQVKKSCLVNQCSLNQY